MTTKNGRETRRLFILAGFDPMDSQIDNSLVYYANALADLGDLIIYMDNDLSAAELQKLPARALYVGANRHQEYDFGSYKRGFNWAKKNLDLGSYDWVYLVNDSVYGPLHPLQPLIEQMESAGTDATGIAINPNRHHPHIQSYFVGLDPQIFMSTWFQDFIDSVCYQSEKGLVTELYEQGLTSLITQHNLTYSALFVIPSRGVYNKVKKLYRAGFPLLKKISMTRHNGAVGRQIYYILRHIDPDLRDLILSDARRVYGADVINKNLTNNVFKIIWRNIKHAFYKLTTKGI